MAKYIDKSALVAEIEKRLSLLEGGTGDPEVMKRVEGVIKGYKSILSFLDTLEVKEVEEETISEDLEYAALLHYPKMSRISEPHGFIPADNKSHYLGDANEDNRKAFIVGAQWQKEQDQSTIELAEDHAMLAGMEKMKQEIIDKAMVWLTSNMKWGVVSWDDKEECVRNFKKAMEE